MRHPSRLAAAAAGLVALAGALAAGPAPRVLRPPPPMVSGALPPVLLPAIRSGGAGLDLVWLGGEPPPLPEPAAGPPPPAGAPLSLRGEPGLVPGGVRRRDPLELPLLETDEAREWLVMVVLNGEVVSEGALVLRDPDGRWLARLMDLRAWRLLLDVDRAVTFEGEPFYPLDAIEGARVEFDMGSLTLTIEVPGEAFAPTRVMGARPLTIAPAAGRGAFVDYDVQFLGGEGVRERLDGLLELGLFDPVGVVVGNLRAGDLTRDRREVVRLETTFIKDFPERRTSLRLGDSLTAGGALGRPVRFAGIQWGSNFATDPAFITFPLPAIGGLAEQRSTVEVFLDNTRRLAEQVPAGPFEIDNLPVVTGAGEVQLRVTDLLGRERLISQSYYVSPRLLRAGLADFSLALGVEREGFNRDSFAYGDPLGVATQRYGFTDWLTGEARAEAGRDRQALGAGGAVLVGGMGLVAGGLIGSLDEAAGGGGSGFLDYEYLGRGFSLGLRSRWASEGFRQQGSGPGPPEARVDQASLGVGLGPVGRLGLVLINSEAHRGRDRRALSANYSVPLGPGSLLLNGLHTLEPSREVALAATYSLPLGTARSLSTGGSWREGASRGSVQYREGRGSSDLGPSWRIGGEAGEGSRRLDGSLRYDAPFASGQLDLAHVRGETSGRANVQGSLAWLDGRAAISRRLGRAFGMVALPGQPDVAVYLENREVGRTDGDGYLLLPRLNPYQANRVRVRAEDLPLSAEMGADEVVVVPYERSGVSVAFDVRTRRSALVTLTRADGAHLPAGLELVGADGEASARVADRGLAYVSATVDGPLQLVSVPGQPAFACALPALPEEPMADLGEVRCEQR